MQKRKAIVGLKFHRLTVLAPATHDPATNRSRSLVRCECGQERVILNTVLLSGRLRSCGCGKRKSTGNLSHGMTATPEFRTWCNMKTRCLNPRSIGFKHYGKRGITVYEGWIHNFPAFLAHVGAKPSAKHSIERIDNERGYEPGNVRWATVSEQARNRRNNHLIECRGKRMTVVEWEKETGVKSVTILCRLRHGRSVEEALTVGNLTPRYTHKRFTNLSKFAP